MQELRDRPIRRGDNWANVRKGKRSQDLQLRLANWSILEQFGQENQSAGYEQVGKLWEMEVATVISNSNLFEFLNFE